VHTSAYCLDTPAILPYGVGGMTYKVERSLILLYLLQSPHHSRLGAHPSKGRSGGGRLALRAQAPFSWRSQMGGERKPDQRHWSHESRLGAPHGTPIIEPPRMLPAPTPRFGRKLKNARVSMSMSMHLTAPGEKWGIGGWQWCILVRWPSN
jgi:hypothetical protein